MTAIKDHISNTLIIRAVSIPEFRAAMQTIVQEIARHSNKVTVDSRGRTIYTARVDLRSDHSVYDPKIHGALYATAHIRIVVEPHALFSATPEADTPAE